MSNPSFLQFVQVLIMSVSRIVKSQCHHEVKPCEQNAQLVKHRNGNSWYEPRYKRTYMYENGCFFFLFLFLFFLFAYI